MVAPTGRWMAMQTAASWAPATVGSKEALTVEPSVGSMAQQMGEMTAGGTVESTAST